MNDILLMDWLIELLLDYLTGCWSIDWFTGWQIDPLLVSRLIDWLDDWLIFVFTGRLIDWLPIDISIFSSSESRDGDGESSGGSGKQAGKSKLSCDALRFSCRFSIKRSSSTREGKHDQTQNPIHNFQVNTKKKGTANCFNNYWWEPWLRSKGETKRQRLVSWPEGFWLSVFAPSDCSLCWVSQRECPGAGGWQWLWRPLSRTPTCVRHVNRSRSPSATTEDGKKKILKDH